MSVLIMFIIAMVCYGVLIGVIIYSFVVFKRTKDLNPLLMKREELLADIRTASSTLEELKEQNNKLRDEAVSYQGIIVEGKKAKEFLENNGGTIEGAENKIAYLKDQIALANDNLSAISSKIDDANKELNQTKEKEQESVLRMQYAEHERAYAEEKLGELTSEVDRTTKELNDLKIELATYESKQREYEDLLIRIDAAKEELKKLEEQIKAAKKELAETEVDITVAKEMLVKFKAKIDNIKGGSDVWGNLDNPLITERVFAEPVNTQSRHINEVSELDKFESKLDSCNIKFDRRTINAFHTSLKVADSSPLVVLAGISGTGKSLLPKLYAKYFGFNFISMAVQPRWDSSQDLFGFYNYAQFSYKATELSRLLWQYDIYNNEGCKFKGPNADKLPMNIVLLDEMNLARIEYYFSDMLSKLEIRRTINEKDEDDRRLSEVELECGSNVLPRHLFVGSNTLFVGTMNEDETTQALSDKVMDRANVLRFGRPKSLEAKADPKRFDEYASDNPMTLREWNLLNHDTKTGFDEKLIKTIDNLNDAMEIAGRPFAHRVKMAMTNYIKNYPGVADSSAAYKNALADQIEFKIMPKLNGIEKDTSSNQDALGKIGNIIGDIDSDLYNEFEKCKNDSNSAFFQWHGVRR